MISHFSHNSHKQKPDLARVKVRTDLVQVWVILEERGFRNIVGARDRNASVLGLHYVGGFTILAGETQADHLLGMQTQSC